MKKKIIAVCSYLFIIGLMIGRGYTQTHVVVVHRPPFSICGSWVVKKYLSVNYRGTTSPDKSLIGENARYNALQVKFGNLNIPYPNFRIIFLTHREFFRGFFMRVSDLGIHTKLVMVVDVIDQHDDDVVAPGGEIIVRRKNEILAYWNGIYYLLKRKNACHDK